MIYLGVDGGGTKTAFILINHNGHIIARTKKEGTNLLHITKKQFRNILIEGISEVCNKINKNINDIEYSFLGIPCYGEDKESDKTIRNIIKKYLNNNYTIGNDVEAGWAGSLACQPGINIVAGTGSIGFGKNEAGEKLRSGGWGWFSSDEGSAYWLGKKLINLYTKQIDNRLEKTLLYEIIKNEYNLKNDIDFISLVNKKICHQRSMVADLAKLLYKSAKEGDKHALIVFDEAAKELSMIVKSLISNLDFKNKKIPVSYSGGVFKAEELILKPFRKYLSDNNVKIVDPILKPVTGAALYAFELSNNLNNLEEVVSILKKQERNLIL